MKLCSRQTGALVAVALLAAATYLLLQPDSQDRWKPLAPPDPWYRAAPDDFFSADDIKELPAAEFAVVTANEADAIIRLERTAWLEVSPWEAEELAGRPLAGTGGRFVLLRGLSWETEYGGFTLRWRPGAVLVQHGCLGDRPLPVVRRAIVARLPDLPSESYVSLGMAE